MKHLIQLAQLLQSWSSSQAIYGIRGGAQLSSPIIYKGYSVQARAEKTAIGLAEKTANGLLFPSEWKFFTTSNTFPITRDNSLNTDKLSVQLNTELCKLITDVVTTGLHQWHLS